jgi:Protein of unknown function (DUF2442)
MIKATSVKPLSKYRLEITFSDGTEGVVGLEHLSGKGIFKQWDENNLFKKVKIDPETDAIVWNEFIDLDPLNLYFKIKGITFEQYQQRNHATN